jgi:endonuclease/exonuclease/phosphatase (EEP) superfamily protein YafD
MLAGVAGFLSFGVLGLCLPLPKFRRAEGPALRVLTFNVGQGRADLRALDALVERLHPDVVALQECAAPPWPQFLSAPGWHVLQKESLWLASRYPLHEERIESDRGELGYRGTIAMCCRLKTPRGTVRVINLHLETPRDGLNAVFSEFWTGADRMREEIERRAKISELASELAGEAPLTLVAGDFNMPIESAIYRRDWSRFHNAFSEVGWGWGGTKLTRWFQVRIDHVLTSDDWEVDRCWLGPRLGSDHRPLIADVRSAE